MPHYAGGWRDPVWNEWEQAPRWRRGDQKFRFRIHFNLEEAQTLYAAPILDDITFVFTATRPRILAWQNNYEE